MNGASGVHPTSLMTPHLVSEDRERDVFPFDGELCSERKTHCWAEGCREASLRSAQAAERWFSIYRLRQVGNGNRRNPGSKRIIPRITLSKPVIPKDKDLDTAEGRGCEGTDAQYSIGRIGRLMVAKDYVQSTIYWSICSGGSRKVLPVSASSFAMSTPRSESGSQSGFSCGHGIVS